MNKPDEKPTQPTSTTHNSNPEPARQPERDADEPLYKGWHRERLQKELDARGISVREGAMPAEMVDALVADDEAGGAKIREDNAPPQET